MDEVEARSRDIYGNMRFTDLSVTLSEELPCSWPGHLPFQHKVYNWFTDREGPQRVSAKRGPYQTRWLAIDEHTGTHIDAPCHGIPPPGSGLPRESPLGLISTADLTFDQASGPAVVIDLTELVGTTEAGLSPPVGPELIEAHEAEYGELRPDDVPLLRADWDNRFQIGAEGDAYAVGPLASESNAWPALTVEAVQLLLERGVRCVGTDAPSIGAVESGGPVHDIGFAGGMVFVEGLAALRELPVKGAIFLAFPLKLDSGTGSPVRAVAIELKGEEFE